MEAIGKSPVAVPLLIAGKLALLLCWVFPLASGAGILPSNAGGPAAVAAGVAFYLGGAVLGALSFASLGKSLSVGLPESATELKTGGVYRFSRNPIYLAAYLLCAGSCVLAPHPLNLTLFLAAALVHHRIILSEEKFLGARFGGAYDEYRRRVRRYIGAHHIARS